MKPILCLLSIAAVSAMAQSADNPITTAIKGNYTSIKNNLIKAAEKMPEENYSFKATEEVRSFGQLIGHVANANFMFCAAAAGEKSPATSNIEKDKTTKADLVQGLKDSFAYCDKVWDGMTDAKAVEKTRFGRNEAPRVGVLAGNNSHNNEHYGNIVTYMRLKKLVPPSSEPRN
jgi:uncharacterized damage-inducible protein DinB